VVRQGTLNGRVRNDSHLAKWLVYRKVARAVVRVNHQPSLNADTALEAQALVYSWCGR